MHDGQFGKRESLSNMNISVRPSVKRSCWSPDLPWHRPVTFACSDNLSVTFWASPSGALSSLSVLAAAQYMPYSTSLYLPSLICLHTRKPSKMWSCKTPTNSGVLGPTHPQISFIQSVHTFLHHFWALLLKPLNCLLLLSCGHLAKMQLDKLGSLLISFTFSDKPNQVRVK